MCAVFELSCQPSFQPHDTPDGHSALQGVIIIEDGNGGVGNYSIVVGCWGGEQNLPSI